MGRNRTIEDAAILRVARHHFLAAGARTTTRAIAAELRISESVLYQRFGSKQALFDAALVPPPEHHERVLRAVAELDAAPNPAAARRCLVLVAFELLQLFRQLAPALVQAVVEPPGEGSPFGRWLDDQPIVAVRSELAGRLRALGARRILHVPDAPGTAEMMIAAAWFVSHHPLIHEPGLPALGGSGTGSPAEAIVDQLWWGLRTDR